MRWCNLVFAALVAGCAYGRTLVPGQSTALDVQASMGKPTAVREHADGTRTLWYSKLPFGRENWAAVLDKNGVLVSFEERLTEASIAKIQPARSTTEDLLDQLGPPYRRTKMSRMEVEAWEYPLLRTPRPQTLYVEVSPDGTVKKLYKLVDRDGYSL